jgi:hypothetical protein
VAEDAQLVDLNGSLEHPGATVAAACNPKRQPQLAQPELGLPVVAHVLSPWTVDVAHNAHQETEPFLADIPALTVLPESYLGVLVRAHSERLYFEHQDGTLELHRYRHRPERTVQQLLQLALLSLHSHLIVSPVDHGLSHSLNLELAH